MIKDQALNKSYAFVYDAKALSIGSFATMMADGTLVNTHLRAARCVNNDFHRDNPSDCNGMVVSFPTVVLISTVLCFATLASLLWIAVHLVDNNPCRAVHDISTMLVIFSVIKVTFMCLHGMFIAMTWYSELTDTRMLGFALLGADLTQILISGWIWLKLLQMQQVCTESEELTWTNLRLQRLPELCFQELRSEACGAVACQENCIICLTDFEDSSQVSQLACGHVFHANCIKIWLSGKKCASCPYRCHGSPLDFA
ncbi:unnamed protein product [Cladocopium goreaui]|uniref:Probable E3 ubiquitin-protein ligase plr-1 (Probable E3 ubiquitin-protein transferase plr-1) n=1 Tax=Cladocopium goreaui TaxID=2562237 RepID=A0A9P1GPF9_9DINO|nr:unnamed protein product [Cladocopium goreaui]